MAARGVIEPSGGMGGNRSFSRTRHSIPTPLTLSRARGESALALPSDFGLIRFSLQSSVCLLQLPTIAFNSAVVRSSLPMSPISTDWLFTMMFMFPSR